MKMKLKIFDFYGRSYCIDINDDATVHDLLERMVENGEADSIKGCKLVLRGSVLDTLSASLADLAIGENDHVVVLRRRVSTHVSNSSGLELKTGPTKKMIEEYMKENDLLPSETLEQMPAASARVPRSHSLDLRSLLKTLVYVGTKIADESAEEDLDVEGLTTVSQRALKAVLDMGFAEGRAKKALVLNRMSPKLAVQWLVEHEKDSDIDEPIPEEQLREIARARKQNQFVPDSAGMQLLTEMGFHADDVIVALESTNNDHTAACSWLLDERELPRAEPVHVGMLPLDEPLVATLLANPWIQAGLMNPRVLQALRGMIAQPAGALLYLNDPE
eukprot:Colp12_sorted_trinity150504_noHs@26094